MCSYHGQRENILYIRVYIMHLHIYLIVYTRENEKHALYIEHAKYHKTRAFGSNLPVYMTMNIHNFLIVHTEHASVWSAMS